MRDAFVYRPARGPPVVGRGAASIYRCRRSQTHQQQEKRRWGGRPRPRRPNLLAVVHDRPRHRLGSGLCNTTRENPKTVRTPPAPGALISSRNNKRAEAPCWRDACCRIKVLGSRRPGESRREEIGSSSCCGDHSSWQDHQVRDDICAAFVCLWHKHHMMSIAPAAARPQQTFVRAPAAAPARDLLC